MQHGDITKIARKAGITPAYMAFIISGKRKPSADVAVRLEAATGISRSAWLWPDVHPNPLLNGTNDGTNREAATS